MQVQVVLTAQQAHAGDKTDKAEIVVAMQVGDKNMVDTATADAVFGHLHLGALAAIDQEQVLVEGHHLGCRVTVKSR
jgi:hypothetical protein